MLLNGQELYEKLKAMDEKERKSKFYELFVEKETLRNIVETIVADDIASDWFEDDIPVPGLDAVEEAFNNLPDEVVATIVKQAWEAVRGDEDQRWGEFTDEAMSILRDVLMDKLRERRKS